MEKDNSTLNLEYQLRSKLTRHGYKLTKPRFRNPELARYYDGYMIVERNRNRIVCGHVPREYSLTIEEVAKFVADLQH